MLEIVSFYLILLGDSGEINLKVRILINKKGFILKAQKYKRPTIKRPKSEKAQK
jgi:hypothetical protein